MKKNTFLTGVVILSIVSLLLTPVIASGEKDPAAGDWLLTSDFNGHPVNSLLMLSKDNDGKYQGSWVSFWGINTVDNLKIEDGKISFTQTNRFRDREMTLTFAGTLKDGKLTGTLSSDEWDSDYEGTRIKPLEPIVGVWEFRSRRGDREFVSTLIVSQGDNGQLDINWKGGPGRRNNDNNENPWVISDVKYEDGKLTFKRKNNNPERPWESTCALTAKDQTVTGTSTSQRGERQIEGKRLHSDLIGKWELTLTSDFGDHKQILWIRPDMTALFGSTDVGKITVENGKISFNYEVSFGDRSFENAFKGQLEMGSLTGEMSNSRGTQQVKGTKMGSAEKMTTAEPAAKTEAAPK